MEDYIFKGLMIDVFSVQKHVDLMKEFPIIGMYPEFVEAKDMHGLNLNDVIRYIVAVYDRKGLIVYEESMQRRKKIAAELVGWRSPDGKIKKLHQEIVDGKVVAVNRMVVRYLKIHKNIKYTSLAAMQEAYYSIVQKMLEPEGIKKTDHDLFRQLESDIETRAVEFLNGDSNKSVLGELYEQIEIDKLELRPEAIARRIRDGLPIVDTNPYVDWTPKKMRLVPREN